MKHKIRRSLLSITLVLALLLPMFSFAFPATTSARFIPGGFSDPGQSAVESLHSYLADINTNCHDMAEGSVLWNDCQDDQNYLNAFAGCSTNMFTITGKFSSGNDSGDDKWGVDQGNVSDCQDKLQDLATISGNAWALIQGLKKCDGVVEAGNNNEWDACQNNYQAPLEGIGCSAYMFSHSVNNKRYIRDGPFNSCLQTVNAMIDFAAKQSCQKNYSGSQLKACEDGYVAQVKGNGASSTCSKYSGQDKAACQDGFGAGSPTGAGGGAGGSIDASCPLDGSSLSWIICPVMDLFQSLINTLDGWITSQLSVGTPGNSADPNQIFCDSQSKDTNVCNAYHSAWASFRDLALGLLVIAGLIFIISEMAGFEFLDAYTMRKVLPRLVIAALAIVLSWQLLQFFVTLVNDLGYGVRFLIQQPFAQAGLDKATLQGGGAALASGLFVGAVTILALAGLFSFLLTGALGVFIAFMVLMIRQVLIIMLILIAPVAIVLYIMPNTNNYFRMWWDTLSKALLMFPLIVGLITAGRVFAAVSTAEGGNAFNQIIGYAAYFAPYFMIPMTFRFAGGMISAIGNGLQQAAQPAYRGLGQYRANKAKENWAAIRANQRWDENFGRFTIPKKVPLIGGKETGIAKIANRAAIEAFDQDELLGWRLGKPRPNRTNPLTGKPWRGVWGTRRGSAELDDKINDRPVADSQQAWQELTKKNGGTPMHYEALRGVAGRHQDYKGHDANGVLIRDRLAAEGFVDSKSGKIKPPSSEDDFYKMGRILQESSSDKERLGGNDLVEHRGFLSSIKHQPGQEYADAQVMAAIGLSAAGRAEPDELGHIGDSIESRLGVGVAGRTMKAAQAAASAKERPELADGHGIIRTRDGHWESSYSEKNFRSQTAVDSVKSRKGSDWSGAKAEGVWATRRTQVHLATGRAVADGTADAHDQQSAIETIRYGIQNPYNDAGQKSAWKKIAAQAAAEAPDNIQLQQLAQTQPMTQEELKQLPPDMIAPAPPPPPEE